MKNLIHNIPVIYYHSVAPRKNARWMRSWLTLKLKYFELHLKYLKYHSYHTLFLDEYLNTPRDTKGNYVVLTFDDGYLDNYIYVYPLLKKYGFKATIFVNPAFVDPGGTVRATLEDYWTGKKSYKEIDKWGFLSWEEMRIMQNSGFVDIQSHTLTHTKYFVSDKLTGFHFPGRDCLYPIIDLYPEQAPFYIDNNKFEKLIPYGYPFFKEVSSVIAKRVKINSQFIAEVTKAFTDFNFSTTYNFNEMKQKILPIYNAYKVQNQIITSVETQEEYEKRLINELKISKFLIEKKLGKPVHFLCWPHGDNNEFTQKKALELGYKATTLGKWNSNDIGKDRIVRIGLGYYSYSDLLTSLKIRYQLNSFRKKQPWYSLFYLYNKISYGKLPY